MNVRAMAIGIGLIAALAAAPLYAQDQQAAPTSPAGQDQATDHPNNVRFGDPTDTARNMQNYVYGVIKKVETDDVVCDKTEFGDDTAFVFNKKTKFIRDGQAAEPSALKVGDKVWIKVKNDKRTGTLIALRVVAGVLSVNMK